MLNSGTSICEETNTMKHAGPSNSSNISEIPSNSFLLNQSLLLLRVTVL